MAEICQVRSDNSEVLTGARVTRDFDDFARKPSSDAAALSTCAFVWVGFFDGAPVGLGFAATRFLFRAWFFLRCDFFEMGLTYLRNFRVTVEKRCYFTVAKSACGPMTIYATPCASASPRKPEHCPLG